MESVYGPKRGIRFMVNGSLIHFTEFPVILLFRVRVPAMSMTISILIVFGDTWDSTWTRRVMETNNNSDLH